MTEYTLDRPTGKVTIHIPTSASDWELYSTMKGVGKAARGMTAALKRSFKAFPKLLAEGYPIPQALGRASRCEGGFDQAMDKYAEFGASDTEPRNNGHQALIDFAKAHCLGSTDGYHSEFGDWL
jgi:hypothetical protein